MVSDTRAPDALWMSAPRFAVELIAWTAAPWALASRSVLLAIAAVVLLIGIPTLFGTLGGKNQRPIIAIPGALTSVVELLQTAVAIIASWAAWPPAVAA